jgi:hypothetical protein
MEEKKSANCRLLSPPLYSLKNDLRAHRQLIRLLPRPSDPPRPVLRVKVRVEVAFVVFSLSIDPEFRRLFLFLR